LDHCEICSVAHERNVLFLTPSQGYGVAQEYFNSTPIRNEHRSREITNTNEKPQESYVVVKLIERLSSGNDREVLSRPQHVGTLVDITLPGERAYSHLSCTFTVVIYENPKAQPIQSCFIAALFAHGRRKVARHVVGALITAYREERNTCLSASTSMTDGSSSSSRICSSDNEPSQTLRVASQRKPGFGGFAGASCSAPLRPVLATTRTGALVNLAILSPIRSAEVCFGARAFELLVAGGVGGLANEVLSLSFASPSSSLSLALQQVTVISSSRL